MKVRQKWPWICWLRHGWTRPVAISGIRNSTEKKARKNAVCTPSISVESSRIMAPLVVKMKPPLTSHSAPCTLGGRRRKAARRFKSDLPVSVGPIGRAQILLQYLADRTARQGGDEIDRLRRLHATEFFLGERDQF